MNYLKESLVRCGRAERCRRDATHWGTTCWESQYFIRPRLSESRESRSLTTTRLSGLFVLRRSTSMFIAVLPHALPPRPCLEFLALVCCNWSQPRCPSHQKQQPSVPETSLWGVDIHSNAIYVCLPAYLSANLRRDPCKEILHQCRPDYRSERDQCQEAQSGVMRPNGETSRGLFNGNEYTMWAQGGVRGRAGSRDQTGEEGTDNHSVWGDEKERGGGCDVYCVCVCVWERVQEGWQNNRNTLRRVSLKLFRSHFKFQPVTVLGIVIEVHGLAQLSSKHVKFLFLLLDTLKDQLLSQRPSLFLFFLVQPAVTTWQSCDNNQLMEKKMQQYAKDHGGVSQNCPGPL